MQNVSQTWKDAALLDGTLYDITIRVGGVDYTSFIETPVIHRYGVTESLIGGALSSSLEFSIIPQGTIPKAAQVQVWAGVSGKDTVFVSDENQSKIQAEDDSSVLVSQVGDDSLTGIPLGTFWINTREPDEKTGVVKFSCVDRMRVADIPYEDNVGNYPMNVNAAVSYILSQMGISLDASSVALSGEIDYPAGVYTMREVLAYIAALNGANCIITEHNTLRFFKIASPGTAVTSCMAATIERNAQQRTISKVMLFPDSGTFVTSGNDTGSTVSADCPYARTSADAAQALAGINGAVYDAYAADTAPLDPAVQVGDAVEVSHKTFCLYNYDIVLNRKIYYKISNPGSDELEQEMIFADPGSRQIDRTVAKSYSEIKKTTDEIQLTVAQISSALDNTVQLSASSYEFIKAEGQTDYSPLSITITDTNPKSEGTYAWFYDGVQVSGQDGVSIAIPRTLRTTAGSVVVRCVWTDNQSNQYQDETSLIWLTGGQDGTDGTDGDSFAWNLLHNTMEPGTDYSKRPNINGFNDNDTAPGAVEVSGGTLSVAEHGVKVQTTSNVRPVIRIGTNDASKAGLYGLTPGKTYTLSFDADWNILSRGTGSANIYYMRCYLFCDAVTTGAWGASYATHNFATIRQADKGVDQTGRCEFTFTLPSNITMMYLQIANTLTTTAQYGTGDYITLRNMMLQEGSKASPWSPAYADMVGKDGQNGASIASVEYGKSDSDTTTPTTWTTSVPALSPGDWLWCKTTYTDGTSAYTKSYAGENGQNGTNGTNGQDAYTIISENEYIEIPVDANERPISNATYNNRIRVYKGLTELTAVIGTPTDGQYSIAVAQPKYREDNSTVSGITATPPTSEAPSVVTYTSSRSGSITGAAYSQITISINEGGTIRALYNIVNISPSMNAITKTYESRITQNADKIALVVTEEAGSDVINTASIVASINESGSSVAISADKIQMTGTTTFITENDIGPYGDTEIDGGRITTGLISADRIDVSDLSAGSIASGTVSIGDVGYIYSYGSAYGGDAIEIHGNYGVSISSYSGSPSDLNGVALDAGGPVYLASHNAGYIQCQGNVLPSYNRGYNLGASDQRWDEVYCGSLSQSSSDRRLKKDIEPLPEKYDKLFDLLRPVRFRMVDGKSGRYHTGMISQDVEDALGAVGLTAMDFAAFCKDTYADPEKPDAYALRYGEFIALCIDQIQKLKAENKSLNDRLDLLEKRLEAMENG